MTGQAAQRSIAGQIEFWARLGRAIEPLLTGDKVLALARAGGSKPLSECLRTVDSAAGRRRVARYLKALPYPHYEAAPGSSGLLVRTQADGKRTVGRFVNRTFRAIKTQSRK
jgi:hypothetical protein